MRAVDKVTAEISARRGPVFSWLVGEPCFEAPPELIDAYARAAGSPPHGYPPHNGLQRLREVLAERHGHEGGAVDPDQIAITSGAKGGLLALFAALLAPGDELIHPQPCYPAYPAMATLLGARPVAVPELNGSFSGWPAAVAQRIGPRARAVVLSSPSNPTGATLDAQQAKTFVELCRERNMRLICDEAYVDFRFAPDCEVVASAYDPDRQTVVQVRSASKSWALCGWRLGWVTADAELAAQAARAHATLINPAPGPAQTAFCALSEVSVGFSSQAREKVERRVSGLSAALNSAGVSNTKPQGGFYLWLDVSKQIEAAGSNSSVAWCVEVARHFGVGLWPGEDFGCAGHVRIAATAPSDNDWPAAVEALADAMRKG